CAHRASTSWTLTATVWSSIRRRWRSLRRSNISIKPACQKTCCDRWTWSQLTADKLLERGPDPRERGPILLPVDIYRPMPDAPSGLRAHVLILVADRHRRVGRAFVERREVVSEAVHDTASDVALNGDVVVAHEVHRLRVVSVEVVEGRDDRVVSL